MTYYEDAIGHSEWMLSMAEEADRLTEALEAAMADNKAMANRVLALEAELAALQAEFDAYKALHPAEPGPDPEPNPEPEPTPTRTMLVGSSLYRLNNETQDAGYARRTKEWGAAPELTRIFDENMPDAWPKFGKARTVFSFKPSSMEGLASGALDAQINGWLDKCPVAGLWPVAVWHEREDDIESGRFSAATAKGADKRLRGLIDKANTRNGTKITFGIVLMGWSCDPHSGRNIETYLPDGFAYDWVGWDAYPGNIAGCDVPGLTATKTNYGRCRDATPKFGAKNWYVCETGTSNKTPEPNKTSNPQGWETWRDTYDTKQAQWITGAVQIAAEYGCKGWMYWDSVTGAGPQNNYQVQQPKAAAAMGAAIKS